MIWLCPCICIVGREQPGFASCVHSLPFCVKHLLPPSTRSSISFFHSLSFFLSLIAFSPFPLLAQLKKLLDEEFRGMEDFKAKAQQHKGHTQHQQHQKVRFILASRLCP
jgi:hypothetical protein